MIIPAGRSSELINWRRLRTKKTTLEQLIEVYSHPSASLFRAIELNALYDNLKDCQFIQPSLDLGCGDGVIAQLLFDSPFTYGVDNGEAKDVEEAINKKIYSKVFLESAEKMSLEDNSVNFIFSNCVIEHIPDEDAVLSEAGRILKKDGSFVFTVPSHLWSDYLYLTDRLQTYKIGFLARAYSKRRNDMLNQFHCYSVEDWEAKLQKHGFKVVNHEYYMSKECLMLWDKIALGVFRRKLFSKNAEQKVFDKYKKSILSCYNNSKVIDEKGAGLFIHCVKV